MNEALHYALRLLKFRPRSEYELLQRLKRRGFCEDIAKKAIAFLKQNSLINDAEFARLWVESRIKKPLGKNRLRQELKLKGIDKRRIEQAIDSLGEKYSEERVIKDLIARRKKRSRGIQPQKAKQRIFLYLLRRGFSPDKIREEITRI